MARLCRLARAELAKREIAEPMLSKSYTSDLKVFKYNDSGLRGSLLLRHAKQAGKEVALKKVWSLGKPFMIADSVRERRRRVVLFNLWLRTATDEALSDAGKKRVVCTCWWPARRVA